LSCDTKKFHDNESTHILHNFWTSTHRGEASPLPPGGAIELTHVGFRAHAKIASRIVSYRISLICRTEPTSRKWEERTDRLRSIGKQSVESVVNKEIIRRKSTAKITVVMLRLG